MRHQLDLCNHNSSDVVATMTVSVIFRPVDTLCHDDLGRVGSANVIDDSISISSNESRTSFKRKVCFTWDNR